MAGPATSRPATTIVSTASAPAALQPATAGQGRLGVGEEDRGAHHRLDDDQAEPQYDHHRGDDHPWLVVAEAEQQRGGRDGHQAHHQQVRG